MSPTGGKSLCVFLKVFNVKSFSNYMFNRISILVFGFSCLFISLPSAASETGRSLGEKAAQSFGGSVVAGLFGDSTLAV